MSEPTKMSELKWDGGSQRVPDAQLRELAEKGSPLGRMMAREMLESREALRRLAALAWDGREIHSMYDYRRILAHIGYEPKESE
jgi:hypothetical protein